MNIVHVAWEDFGVVLSPQITENIQKSLHALHMQTCGTIEGELELTLEGYDAAADCLYFMAPTTPRMQNIAGMLHGGACAFLLDEAMGCTANSIRTSDSIAPTSQMQLNYHHPVHPGENVRICVRVISMTRHFIHVAAELSQASDPTKVCVSAAATYYCK